MKLLQTIYIDIFNEIFKLTGKINQNIREWIVRISIFLLMTEYFVLTILTLRDVVDFYVIDATKIGTLFLIIVCIFSVNAPLKHIRWNKWIVYPYLAAAAYMTLMSIDHFTGRCYQAYALQMLFIFPALYFIWGNRGDYVKYIDWIAKSLVIIGTITTVCTFIFAPVSDATLLGTSDRYMGLTFNPNRLGTLTIMITAACLYLTSKRDRWAIFYIVLSGINVGFTIMSGSRTAILVVIFQIIAFLIILMRIDFVKNKIKTSVFILFSIAIIAVSIPVTEFALNQIGNPPTSVKSETVDGSIVHSDSTNNTPLQETSRFSVKGKSLDDFSSGRIEIWKWYLERMHIRGNDCTNHEVIYGNGSVVHNAHNTFLEIPFRFGIPAGIFYALFMMGVIIVLIKAAVIKGSRRYVIFIVMASLAYFIEAMLDVMTLPFERGPVLLFYMSLVGIFEGNIYATDNSIKKQKEDKSIYDLVQRD